MRETGEGAREGESDVLGQLGVGMHGNKSRFAEVYRQASGKGKVIEDSFKFKCG